jgi:hypothetical protein
VAEEAVSREDAVRLQEMQRRLDEQPGASSRHVLERAIRHEPCAFTQSGQAIAATWAFETCPVFQATQADHPIAPRPHFLQIRRSRTPPPQAAVWSGSHYRFLHDPVSCVYVQRPLALAPLDDKLEDRTLGYLCFLAVGGLSFVVVAHRYRNHAEITYNGPFDQAIDQIWPGASGLLAWPPRVMLDRDLVDAIILSPGGFTIRV